MTHRDYEGHRDYQSGQNREQERMQPRHGRGGRSEYEEPSEYSARVQRQDLGHEPGYSEYYGSPRFGEQPLGANWHEGSGPARESWEYEGGPERFGSSGYGEEQHRDPGARRRGQWTGGQREQGIYGSGAGDYGDYYGGRQRYVTQGSSRSEYNTYGRSPTYLARSDYARAQQGEWRDRYATGRRSYEGADTVRGGDSPGYGGYGSSLHGGQSTDEREMPGYGSREQEWGGSRYINEPGRSYSGPGTGHSYRGVGPKNYRRSDERLMEDISERLTDDEDLDASEITVRVLEGKVTLEGTVDHRWMKHRAEDIADACTGVKDVDNRILVTPSSRELGARDAARSTPRTSTTGSTATGTAAPEMGAGTTSH